MKKTQMYYPQYFRGIKAESFKFRALYTPLLRQFSSWPSVYLPCVCVCVFVSMSVFIFVCMCVCLCNLINVCDAGILQILHIGRRQQYLGLADI